MGVRVQFVVGGETDLADDVGGDIGRHFVEIVKTREDEETENFYGSGADHDLVDWSGVELPRAETASGDDDDVDSSAVGAKQGGCVEHLLIDLTAAHEECEKSSGGILIGT